MSSLVSRRRNTPWLHRWARPIIGTIASLGILNTTYLTISKFAKVSTVCPTSGCDRVLESPYAELFGLPLSLFGLLAYLGMAALAFSPLLINPEKNRPLRTDLEQKTWWAMFVGTTVMTVFSGYLMYIMFTQFVAKFGPDGICYYCLASATFAVSMLVLTLLGRDWEDVGQLIFTGAIVAMVTFVGTLAIYAPLNPPSNSGETPGNVGYPVANTSGEAEIALAKHLTQVGAKMYSAYWCPHCHDQKELFGKEATKVLPVVECAPDGQNSQTALCTEIAPKAQTQTGQAFGFPTWEINGKFYPGTQSLTELARISGYKGAQNFKNGV